MSNPCRIPLVMVCVLVLPAPGTPQDRSGPQRNSTFLTVDAAPEILVDVGAMTEGPIAAPDGTIYFVDLDIPNGGTIWRWPRRSRSPDLSQAERCRCWNRHRSGRWPSYRWSMIPPEPKSTSFQLLHPPTTWRSVSAAMVGPYTSRPELLAHVAYAPVTAPYTVDGASLCARARVSDVSARIIGAGSSQKGAGVPDVLGGECH